MRHLMQYPIHTCRVSSGVAMFLFAALAAPVVLAQASLTGTWNGAVLEARSNCSSAQNNGDHGTYAQYDIGIANGTISISQAGITGLQCDYVGTYSQNGAAQQASGTFLCSDGRRGTWLATQFLVTQNAMSLNFSEQLNGNETCTINAVLGGTRLSATQAPLPSIDYTGAWYKADESGWGVSIVKGTNNVLGVIIYHYDPDHSPVWFLLLNGAWQNTTTYSGTLYRYAAPSYSETFNPGAVTSAPVGAATLNFTSATEATLSYSVNNVMLTKAITRLFF